MNRLSFVEAIESNRLRKNNLFLFICLSILISHWTLFSQVEKNLEKISLNGFGRYIFIDDKIKFSSVSAFDFDGDGIVDIGGLDESGKNFFVYYGKGSNIFSNPIKYSFAKNYSGFVVKNLKIDGKTNLILFSRLDGLINIYSFYGRSISRQMNISIDCCFSNLEAVNLDSSPELELVIYGSNFKGFGIISLIGFNNFTYKKIGQESFSRLLPMNLNADNKIDLVGFNPFSKELVLLRNNSLFNYSRNVYKKFDVTFDEVLTGNFDDDLLTDLALISSQTKNLFILYGNGIGSFSHQDNFRLISNYSSTIVYDYNRDLIDDFIVYDRFTKKLMLKSVSQTEQLKSLPIIEIEKLYSMNIYRTLTTKGIVVSSSEGLFLIVQSSLSFKSQKFAISSNPVDLQTFRSSNELFPKIIFIDRENLKLNILTRNEFNSPQDLFFIPISYKYEKLKILQASDNELHIVCYKPLIYNFDYFVINLRENKFKREIVTIDGLVKEINFEPSSTDKILLNIIAQSKNELRTIVYKPFDVNKILLNEKLNPLNFLDYTYDSEKRNLFTIHRDASSKNIIVKEINFDPSFKKSTSTEVIKIKDEDYLSAQILFCENFKNEKFLYLNLSNLKQNNLFIIPLENPDRKFVLEEVSIEDKSSCKCKSQPNNLIKDFVYFNSNSKNIEMIQFRSKGKPYNLPVKNLTGLTSYSIDYSLKRNAEIVYISNYSIINIETLNL